MSYDFDRFMDALNTRASSCGLGDPNPYKVGYMTSLLKELYNSDPVVADKIADTTKFLEDLIMHDRVYSYNEDDMLLEKPL